jgi:6-phosphogluconate dehydrogenase
MRLGMVGLGRMGANMARRLIKRGHNVVVWTQNPASVAGMASEGAIPSASLADLVSKLNAPRAVWVMIPAGDPTESVVGKLSELLEPGDTVIDGGNSHFKDDVRRAQELAKKGLYYLDVGTSGGVWGLERGYCLMIGGKTEAVARLEPVFRDLAPGRGGVMPSLESSTAPEGFLHCGPSGAGHFVKMIHNGIEYGLMQAYAEGFDILANADSEALDPSMRYDLKLPEIAELWRRGSVVGSWLLDLTAMALAKDPNLEAFIGQVPDSGEGRWTIQAALEEAVPADVLSAALYTRFRSRQSHTFAEKLLSAMRAGFGGHKEA